LNSRPLIQDPLILWANFEAQTMELLIRCAA
jgi:hypothetical protein